MADGDYFVDVPIETDAATLADGAIAALQTVWPTWEPNDGDLEVVQIETLAGIAQAAAEAASKVPSAIFRAFGTQLAGVPYLQGVAATTTVTFALTGTAAQQPIPAGTTIDLDGYAFQTTQDTPVVGGGASVTGVPVEAADIGTEYNDRGTLATMISAVAYISDVTADQPSTGGQDAEDDAAYQDRLAKDRRLAAKTIVTTGDYELTAMEDSRVTRAVAISDAATRSINVTAIGPTGDPVDAATKTALAATFALYRMSTWVVNVVDASYATVNVTYAVQAYSTFDLTDLVARINSTLIEALSPGSYGRPKNFGDPGTSPFVNDPVVRKNKLIDLIGDVDGVNYVVTVSLTSDTGFVDSNGDLTMPGTVALPRPGTMTGTANA